MFFAHKMKPRNFVLHKTLQIFFVGLIVFILNVYPIAAQGIAQWAPDKKIPGYSDAIFHTPFLVADQNRAVHSFAVQPVGASGSYTIVYNQWNKEKNWSIPVDIFFLPAEDVQIIGVFLDSTGIVHLAFFWSSKFDAGVFYTYAQISRAGDVSAWSLPVEVGAEAISPSYGVITGDNKGDLYIIYNGKMDGKGVYAVMSDNSGITWSATAPVFVVSDDQLIPFSVNGYMGKSGKLHLVWNVVNSANEYTSLYYDKLDIATNRWDKPILLAERPQIKGFFGPASPFVVDNGKYVVIMYNGGNPYINQPVGYGRPTLLVRTSTDNGNSWSIPMNPFPLLTGSSGEHSLIIDSNQNIHALAFMRIDRLINGQYSAIDGMWHSEFRNNTWSDPERTHISIAPLSLRSVISQGNVLLAIWIEESTTGGGVWYSYTMLDSPELPVVALPTPSHQSVSAPTLSVSSLVATPTQVSSLLLLDQDNKRYAPAQPLILGIIPAVLLIISIFVVVQLRHSRKNSK